MSKDKKKFSDQFAENTETENGWNEGDLRTYGSFVQMESFISIAKGNNLENVRVFWERELEALAKHHNLVI